MNVAWNFLCGLNRVWNSKTELSLFAMHGLFELSVGTSMLKKLIALRTVMEQDSFNSASEISMSCLFNSE